MADYKNRFSKSFGRVDGSTPGTGEIAETLEQRRLRSAALSLTSNVPANMTATPIVLTPGLWEIFASAYFLGNGSTALSTFSASISTVSATELASDDISKGRVARESGSVGGLGQIGFDIIPFRMNVTTNTTIYLVATANFSGGTGGLFGTYRAERR